MLERILESHSKILGGPEPHILTPLAHLGFWGQSRQGALRPHPRGGIPTPLRRATPGQGPRLLGRLPRPIATCSTAVTSAQPTRPSASTRPRPYALILPFMMKVFPDAKYIVLTRHPIATFSSYANSFFNGDYQAAQDHNPLLNRYVPAIAAFLRQEEVPFIHVRYEDLVKAPESSVGRIYEYIGGPFEKEDYRLRRGRRRRNRTERTRRPHRCQAALPPLNRLRQEMGRRPGWRPRETHTHGNHHRPIGPRRPRHPRLPARRPLAPPPRGRRKARQGRAPGGSHATNSSAKLIVGGRNLARKSALLRKLLKTLQLACDVLLRE